jgi:hypothetical protein
LTIAPVENGGTIRSYVIRSPNALHREGDDSETRELVAPRRTVRLHKSLLDMERRATNGTWRGEHRRTFRLVVDDAQFGWLNNISVVRIDEALTGKG